MAENRFKRRAMVPVRTELTTILLTPKKEIQNFRYKSKTSHKSSKQQ